MSERFFFCEKGLNKKKDESKKTKYFGSKKIFLVFKASLK